MIDLYGLAAVISALTSFGAMVTSMIVAIKQKKIAKAADVSREEIKTIVNALPQKDIPPC